MSNRYTRLMDLLRRPQGCRVEEASVELGVTRAGCRGMIRDLKELVPVETVYDRHGGRGKGRSAVHFVRTQGPVPDIPDAPAPRGMLGIMTTLADPHPRPR